MKHNHAITGATFIELILYISILSIFMTGVVQFAWDIIYGRVKTQTQQELSYNLRFAAKRIAYEIRNANGYTISNPQTLELTVDEPSRTPTVLSMDNGQIMIGFGLSGQCPVTDPCPLTSNAVTISNMTVSDNSQGNSNNISLSITGQTNGNRSEYNLTDSIAVTAEVRTMQ